MSQGEAALDTRPLAHSLEPAFDVGEVIELLPLPLMRHDPGPTRDVRTISQWIDAIADAGKVHDQLSGPGIFTANRNLVRRQLH